MSNVEELVDHALRQAHERLQARCDCAGIVEIFEEEYGVYDGRALCQLLSRRYDHVEETLKAMRTELSELHGAYHRPLLMRQW